MTTSTAARYVLIPIPGIGPDYVPRIYPGDLTGVSTALGDIKRLSAKLACVISLDAIYAGARTPFRVYDKGECIWSAE